MQVTVHVYTGRVVTGIRFFKSLQAANRFIARQTSAWIYEVTR